MSEKLKLKHIKSDVNMTYLISFFSDMFAKFVHDHNMLKHYRTSTTLISYTIYNPIHKQHGIYKCLISVKVFYLNFYLLLVWKYPILVNTNKKYIFHILQNITRIKIKEALLVTIPFYGCWIHCSICYYTPQIFFQIILYDESRYFQNYFLGQCRLTKNMWF